MIAQILKEKTRDRHDTIEAITNSSKIFDNTFTIDDYKKLLTVNGVIVNGFMDAIFEQLPADVQEKLAFTANSKKEAISKDAQELNIDMSSTKQTLGEANLPFALGALYVMEGSMLGGNVIAKTLKKDGNFDEHSFNYFTFYKDMLGPNWKNFLALLAEQVQSEEDQQSCLNGALQVYDHLIDNAKVIFAN